MSYDDIGEHWLMLKDELRTQAYKAAIQQVVQASDSVIDFGCGTGILSFFCANAGAKNIYAIDRSKIIRIAEKIAAQNAYQQIKFFYGDETNFQITEKVQVIVSEWMGHFVFAERMFEGLLKIRDQFLVENGRMIPASVSLKVGLVCDQNLYEELCYFQNKPYGIDYSFLGDWLFNRVHLKRLTDQQVLKQTIALANLDMLSVTTLPKLSGSIIVEQASKIYAICGWFEAQLSDDIVLKTGPFDLPTHWQQIVFPLPEPLMLKTGDQLTVTIKPYLDYDDNGTEGTSWFWSLSSIGKNYHKNYQMNGFLRNAWVKRPLSLGWLGF